MAIKDGGADYYILAKWRNFRLKLFIEGIIIGLIAGFIVVLFRFLLEEAELLRGVVYRQLQTVSSAFIALWFVVLFIIAYLLGLIIKFEPLSGGSGIPQAKGVILGLMKMNWRKVLAAKFIGGVLAIGAGLSLGREGPSIQIGAVVGQGLSRVLGRTRLEERYLLTSGASAGLAAAFNAPLAGVVFSLEELHKNFSPAILLSAIAASLTADFIARYFSGRQPFFNFSDVPVLPFHHYGYLMALGIITGILGVIFNKVLVKSLDMFAWQRLPARFKAVIPLFAGGVAGFVLPQILGGGNNLIGIISQGQLGLTMLFVLLAAKFLFTMLSYGSGVPGGIFLPMLVIGALTGAAFGSSLQLFNLAADYRITFVILAMAGLFTAIVKAPITGSILITEMTGSFSHLLELIAISMTAYIVADLANSQPVYDTLLERSLKGMRKMAATEKPGCDEISARTVVEMIVCIGSQLDKQKVKNIDWPVHSLLLCIKRGEQEIVPTGEITLFAGDYLYVSAEESQISNIKALAGDCNL